MFDHQGEVFATEDEAIKSLAQDLRAIFKEKHPQPKKKKCCLKSKGNFCSTCGKRLAEEEFDTLGFQQWLWGLLSDTNDSLGYHEWSEIEDREIMWQPSHPGNLLEQFKEGFSCVFVNERAEKVICEALGLDDVY